MGASAQASRSPVAPRRELVEAVVKEAYEKFKNDANGKNADYIPYLAQVDSKLFGVAIDTTDNQVFTLLRRMRRAFSLSTSFGFRRA